MEKEKKTVKKRSCFNIGFNILIILFSILILGFVFNFCYSIGYAFMIFIHELGHFIAAKYLNIKVRFGNITPFGAYIIHESTENSFQNAFIALLGPIFGSVCALVYYIIVQEVLYFLY